MEFTELEYFRLSNPVHKNVMAFNIIMMKFQWKWLPNDSEWQMVLFYPLARTMPGIRVI